MCMIYGNSTAERSETRSNVETTTGQGSWPPSFLISPSRRNYGTKAVENALLAFSKKARVGKSDNGCEGTPVCRTPGGVSRSYSCTGASAKLRGQGSWHRHSPPHFPVSCCGLAPAPCKKGGPLFDEYLLCSIGEMQLYSDDDIAAAAFKIF